MSPSQVGGSAPTPTAAATACQFCARHLDCNQGRHRRGLVCPWFRQERSMEWSTQQQGRHPANSLLCSFTA
eukprot:6381160-Pyramimonas_sp.AAC.1